MASAFSFAQISVRPFVRRVENKKLLKNSVQNGILVGYHLETQIKPEQKNFKRFFKTVEFYPFEIPNL